MPKADCLKVAKDQGEKIIALAHKLALIDKGFVIQRKENHLLIPLVRKPNKDELSALKKQAPKLIITAAAFTEKRVKETFMHSLEKQLPPELASSIPHSLDIIGDIAIIEIPQQLKLQEKLIGQTILQTQKNIKTVLAKAGIISGVYRIRALSFIAGEDKTQTVYNEYGCHYHVDVAKAYFSPRLSNEHHRVALLVEEGETVVDLFAGVGPFAVLIGKMNQKAKAYAADINPEAIELLKINAKANKVDDRVFPILGDARELSKTKLNGIADRVIMNLPETAIDFVDAACNTIKLQGGIVHFYGFVRKPDTIEEFKLRFSKAVESSGRKVIEYLNYRNVRETAPFESQVVLDVKIV